MSAAFAKRPVRPAGPLTRLDADILDVRPTLWRVHRTLGSHVQGWSALRHGGPAVTARFDPHPEPAMDHLTVGVTCAALDLATAVTEAFQHVRLIDTAGGRPKATSWLPTRPLRLLDLTGDWALRQGASQAWAAGPRATCRAWARVIAQTWPDLDGVWAPSTLTGRPVVTLWTPAADSFPTAPEFSEYLDSEAIWAVLREITRRYPTYRVI